MTGKCWPWACSLGLENNLGGIGTPRAVKEMITAAKAHSHGHNNSNNNSNTH